MFQKSNQEVHLFAGFKTAHEIPFLNKNIQEWVHCALQKMWGELVPCVPSLRNMDSPEWSRAGGEVLEALYFAVLLIIYDL